VAVVGIGADGWDGLSPVGRDRIGRAEVLVAGARVQALVPEVEGQVRAELPSPLRAGLRELMASYAGKRVVVVASGDPFVSGIGSTLVDLFGHELVEVLPAVSSVALARARMGWPAESTQLVSLVARDPHLLLRQLAPGHRVLVLSSDESTPAFVAGLLTSYGYGETRMTVLGHLGSSEESRLEGTASTWSADSPRLNVLALALEGPVIGSWATGLPDELFGNDGQLTKRDLRAGALARLAPQPGELLWDVGAGAGSVGIEWMRSHPRCRAIAVEADADRATQIGFNARHLGVPHLEVVNARAPEALAELPDPDAIFVGGGATAPGLLETCLSRLSPGGRLVVHGVTLETETLLASMYAEHGGELTRHSVEHAAPIGSFTGWTPSRAVTMWAVAR
jgi:precorrin-6B C5,15-methyltransferase / cobalt-precorrin-6B C5,C15-methyltransferase